MCTQSSPADRGKSQEHSGRGRFPERTKNVSVSLRKKWERIAQMTTDSDPMGVTKIASVKALGGAVSQDPEAVAATTIAHARHTMRQNLGFLR